MHAKPDPYTRYPNIKYCGTRTGKLPFQESIVKKAEVGRRKDFEYQTKIPMRLIAITPTYSPPPPTLKF